MPSEGVTSFSRKPIVLNILYVVIFFAVINETESVAVIIIGMNELHF